MTAPDVTSLSAGVLVFRGRRGGRAGDDGADREDVGCGASDGADGADGWKKERFGRRSKIDVRLVLTLEARQKEWDDIWAIWVLAEVKEKSQEKANRNI